jgi:pimeloyl-ACP methyl ester carboxylesterase
MLASLELSANGMTFRGWTGGSGPLVLLLHGFPDSPRAWLPIAEALVDEGFRVAVPAMRGYHPTDIPADGDYRPATLGRDVPALVAALGESRAAVVGHDWGAFAAYAAANLGREVVTRLCALAIPHPRIVRPNLETLWRATHFTTLQLGPIAHWWVRRDDFAYIDALYRQWSPTWTTAGPHIASIKDDFRIPGRVEAAVAYYAALPGALWPSADNRRVRERTTQPALVIVGDDDGVLRFATDFVGIEECFTGGLELVHVPGVGHFVPSERPELVLERLVPFLRG